MYSVELVSRSGTWCVGLIVIVAFTIWGLRQHPRTLTILIGLSLLEGLILMVSVLSMLPMNNPPARNILSPLIYDFINWLVPALFLGAVISYVRRKPKTAHSGIAALSANAAWLLQSFYLVIIGLHFLLTVGGTRLSATSPDGSIHVMVVDTMRSWEGEGCLVIARRSGHFWWHPVGEFGGGDGNIVEGCRADWTVPDHVRIWARVYASASPGAKEPAPEKLAVDMVMGAQ